MPQEDESLQLLLRTLLEEFKTVRANQNDAKVAHATMDERLRGLDKLSTSIDKLSEEFNAQGKKLDRLELAINGGDGQDGLPKSVKALEKRVRKLENRDLMIGGAISVLIVLWEIYKGLK